MTEPELYLVLETGEKPDAKCALLLEAATDAAPVASVLLAPPQGQTISAPVAKPLIELAQRKGIAALIADDASLARQLKADGVHLTWHKDQARRYREAREILDARAIVGADAGRSRDDAMSLGEAGADYVAFGIPPHVEDRATAGERQLELVGWWSDLFEVPCVAFDVASIEDAAALSKAGADFVCLKISAASDTPASVRERIATFVAAAQMTETA